MTRATRPPDLSTTFTKLEGGYDRFCAICVHWVYLGEVCAIVEREHSYLQAIVCAECAADIGNALVAWHRGEEA